MRTLDRNNEFKLEDIKTGKVSNAEVISLFDIGNLNINFYSGYILKHIFNKQFNGLKDHEMVEMEANMLNCVVDIKKNNKVIESIDFSELAMEEVESIVEKLMEVNKTRFLVSYLGNIIIRR